MLTREINSYLKRFLIYVQEKDTIRVRFQSRIRELEIQLEIRIDGSAEMCFSYTYKGML